jgi:hypothetical protein
MAIQQPLFQENDTTDQHAIQLRTMLRDIYGNRGGVMASGNMLVAQRGAGANNSVDISTGSAMVPGSATALQGFYYVYNDATVNLPITPADPSNPRNTLVIARVRDSFYSGSDNDAQLLAVDGTPAGSPADPDLVALGYTNYLVLARIVVPAGAASITTAMITNIALWTTPIGTTLICTSTTRPSSPPTGTKIFETDTLRYMRYDGTTWRYLPWHSGTNPHMCEIKRTAGTTFTANTVSIIDFDAVVDDPGGMAALTPTNTITVNRSGRWEIDIEWTVATPGGAFVGKTYVYVNGALVRRGLNSYNPGSAGPHTGGMHTNMRLVNGDVLTARLNHVGIIGNQIVTDRWFYARLTDI